MPAGAGAGRRNNVEPMKKQNLQCSRGQPEPRNDTTASLSHVLGRRRCLRPGQRGINVERPLTLTDVVVRGSRSRRAAPRLRVGEGVVWGAGGGVRGGGGGGGGGKVVG